MNHRPRKHLVKKVGLSSAIALTMVASGVGVASAATHTHAGLAASARSANDSTSPPPLPGGPGGPGGVGGDVTALTSTSITVANRDGTTSTYDIDASTTVSDRRQATTVAALAVGENVHVVLSTTDSSVAASIDIAPAVIAGKVTTVSADTITVTDPQGATATIVVSAATTYAKGGASASFSDVSVGTFVFAEGTFGSSSTTLEAATVGIGLPPLGDGPAPGARPGPVPGVAFAGTLIPPSTAPSLSSKSRGASRS